MSFSSILREIVEGCGGGVSAALMGNDGIPIEQVTGGDGPDSPLADDIGTAGVEFGRVLEEIRKASDALAGGALTEVVVCLSRVVLVFRSVDRDNFLVLALSPDGNLGKARYLIRRHVLALQAEL